MKNTKEKICLLHICGYAAPYRGNFIETLESLDRYGESHNIYLFPNRAKNLVAYEWIKKMNSPQQVAYIQEKSFFKNIFLIKKIVKEHKVDFIFCHFSDYITDVIIKVVFNGKKVIRFFHSMYEEQKKFKNLIRKIVWNKNMFVGVSQAVSNSLKKEFENFSINTIENAICFERLDRTDFFNSRKNLSFLTMGYNMNVKGTDLALEVVNKLREKYDVCLYIVVAGSRDKIKAYLEKKFGSIPSWVVILPAIENIASYYSNIDIFLSPSRSEAFGYAVVEAAYCRTSIVASKVGGQKDLDVDGVYWFESENIDDFYEKAELAINELSVPQVKENKERVREYIQTRYSLERWSKEVMDLLC